MFTTTANNVTMECGPQEVKMLRQTLKGIRVVVFPSSLLCLSTKQGGETKQVGKNKTKQTQKYLGPYPS